MVSKPKKKKPGATRGRPSNATRVAAIKEREREAKATEWLEHCERQLADALRDAPDKAAQRSLERTVRRVLWAHFETLARGRNAWPPDTPSGAVADITIGEYSVLEHVADVAQLVRERLEGLHG